jgi:hypothetical protein
MKGKTQMDLPLEVIKDCQQLFLFNSPFPLRVVISVLYHLISWRGLKEHAGQLANTYSCKTVMLGTLHLAQTMYFPHRILFFQRTFRFTPSFRLRKKQSNFPPSHSKTKNTH